MNMGPLRRRLSELVSTVQEDMQARQGGGLVDRINEEWFILSLDGKMHFCQWQDDRLSMMGKTDFAIAVAPLSQQTGENPPHEVYIRSSERRMYTGLVIDPEGDAFIGGKVNLWRGYAVKPKKGRSTSGAGNLCPRYRLFVLLYLENHNARESARRAGCSNPKQQGSRMLSNVAIRAAVNDG